MFKNMFTGFKTKTLSLSIAAISSLSMGSATLAQDNDAVEEINITGTRIRQSTGMTTPVPVTAVTMPELTNFDPGGTVSEQLNGLPQFFGNRSAQSSTGALNAGSGSSNLNLRGIGPNRTLVLFDGSRVVPADINGATGIDTFPTALMRTVDVVTGGASAAYGADALGGVVNFVLNREFQGLRAQVGTGTTEFGDGSRWDFSIAGGTQIGDKLNVIGSVEARHINQILRDPQKLDDWWQRWGHVTNPAWVSLTATPNIPQRLTLPWVSSTLATPTGMIWAATRTAANSLPLTPFALNGMTFTNDGQNVRPFIRGDVYAGPTNQAVVGSSVSQSGGPESQIANAAFENGPYGAETVGRSGFGAIKYDFTDTLSGFAQVMIGRSETNSPGRRSAYNLSGTSHATIFRDNAFLPASVAAAMDAAGITSFQLHKQGSFKGDNTIGLGDGRETFTTISWSTGLELALPNEWDLRATWQSGESRNNAGLFGQTRQDRVYLGMDAVRDPNTGAIVCRVQLFNPTPAQLANTPALAGRESPVGGKLKSPIGLDNTIRDCVPYNVMGAGNMSQEAVEYTQSPRSELSIVEQDFAEILLTGDLLEAWQGPLSFAAGLTWRDQSFEQTILPRDVYELGPPLNAPELGIRGIPSGVTGGSETLHRLSSLRDASGDLDVWEWFTELNLPLWESQSGSQSLDSNASYRSSDYSRSGRIDSWKLGLDFQVFEDLRLRATKSRDVREPTFFELYNTRGGGPGNVLDPVTGTQYGTTAKAAGNPDLRPEIGNTLVAGMVYQPSWFNGFQLSADWYEVEIQDAVNSLGAQAIVDGCYFNNAQDFCQLITRDDTGLIVMIINGALNVDQERAEGIDVEASYRMEPDFFADESESLSLRLLAGHIIERARTPLNGTPTPLSGAVGSPEVTANATLGYNVGPYGIQFQQRFIDNTKVNINWVEGRDVDDNTVASGNYTNLRLSYEGDMSEGGTWNVSFNVTNLFDRSPPIVASGSGNQNLPSGYDLYGRRYQISFNVSL